MIIEKILIGSKDELLEHFYSFTKDITKHLKAGSLLYSKEGLETQLDEIVKKKNGLGRVFYLTHNEKRAPEAKLPEEVSLTLMSAYVQVREMPL